MIVGGTTWSRIASSDAISSTAPAAPSMCPVIDFVEETLIFPAASPNTLAMAVASFESLSGVDVPWAFT